MTLDQTIIDVHFSWRCFKYMSSEYFTRARTCVCVRASILYIVHTRAMHIYKKQRGRCRNIQFIRFAHIRTSYDREHRESSRFIDKTEATAGVRPEKRRRNAGGHVRLLTKSNSLDESFSSNHTRTLTTRARLLPSFCACAASESQRQRVWIPYRGSYRTDRSWLSTMMLAHSLSLSLTRSLSL